MDEWDTYLKDYCNIVHAVCENIDTNQIVTIGPQGDFIQVIDIIKHNQCMSTIIQRLPCDTWE